MRSSSESFSTKLQKSHFTGHFFFINWNRRQLCKRHTESTDTCPCCRQTSRQFGRLWQLLHPKKLSPVVPVVVYNARWMILTICFLTQLSQVLFGCEYPGCSQGYVLATLCLSFQSAIIVAFLRKAIIVAFLRKATFGSGRTVTSETLSLWTCETWILLYFPPVEMGQKRRHLHLPNGWRYLQNAKCEIGKSIDSLIAAMLFRKFQAVLSRRWA